MVLPFPFQLSTPAIITVGLIGEGAQGEWQEPVHGGVGDGTGVAKGAVACAAGDPNLGEPVHEGLAAVRVEHAHHDADQTVVIGPERISLRINLRVCYLLCRLFLFYLGDIQKRWPQNFLTPSLTLTALD